MLGLAVIVAVTRTGVEDGEQPEFAPSTPRAVDAVVGLNSEHLETEAPTLMTTVAPVGVVDSPRDPAARAAALEAGGWTEGAREAYIAIADSIADSSPDSIERRHAAVSAARLALDADEPEAAISALSVYSSTLTGGSAGGLSTTQSPWPVETDFHYGQALVALGRAEPAAAAFERFAAVVPALADIGFRAAGDAWLEAGQPAAAAAAYARALESDAPISSAVLSAIKLGNARLRMEDFEGAISAYSTAESRAEIPSERAQAMAGMVAAHLDAGDEALAMDVRRRLVRELPRTSTARTSLERLLEAGIEVPSEEAAAVFGASGEQAAALAQIQSAIDDRESAGGFAPPAWHLSALRYNRALGDFDAVYARADELITSGAAGAAGDLAAQVALLRARALETEAREGEAIEAFLALADDYPGSPEAAEALWRRARWIESSEGLIAGADAHELFARRRPDDFRAFDAAFRAGWLRWRAGRLDEAESAWSALAASARAPAAQRARAEYWLGRIVDERNGVAAAGAHWESAVAADPEGYFGLVAAERLGLPLTISPPPSDGDSEPAEVIGTWLATWSWAGDSETWQDAQESIPKTMLIARGAALLQLGEGRAARRALKAGLRELDADPVRLAALALFAETLGLPEIAIPAAADALRQAPPAAKASAPAALRRLIYPIGHAELVRAEAIAHGVPPSLLFALIWQESRFDPAAISSAGARGLTQVMPATGADIAGRLGDAGYFPEQLYRPHIAARYGAWYLAQQLDRLDADSRVALAAYNGGPGNARKWLDASGGDIDVFVETIHLSETRRYVPAVMAARAWYAVLDPDDDAQ